jgi:hypothetical protein
MSDSLTRLLMRAQGAPPTVEPVLPSRYAAPAPEPMLWEPSEPLPAIPEPAAMPGVFDVTEERPVAAEVSPPAPKPMPSADEPVEPVVSSAAIASAPSRPGNTPPAEPLPEQPTQLRLPAQPLRSEAPIVVPVRVAYIDREPEQPEEAFAVEGSAGNRAAKAPHAVEATAPERQLPNSRPRGASRGAPVSGNARVVAPEDIMPAGPGRPEVRISIGRVEVHALPPPARPVRMAPPRRPTVSLADYLARRSGRAS